MNYSTSVMLINENIRAVRGRYEDGGKAVVFKTIDQSIKVDDFVVVESGTRWNVTTVKITEIDVSPDFDSNEHMHWVISKIDMAAHQKVTDMESQAIELIKKGELRKRREDIKKNTLDAFVNGEIETLGIAQLGSSNLVGSN